MTEHIATSKDGVNLFSLNWGYQITHAGRVLAAINDTQLGPQRSETCSEQARQEYERICRLYERLCGTRHKPSELQLSAFRCVLYGLSTRAFGVNTLKSLERRGMIACDDYALGKWRVIE